MSHNEAGSWAWVPADEAAAADWKHTAPDTEGVTEAARVRSGTPTSQPAAAAVPRRRLLPIGAVGPSPAPLRRAVRVESALARAMVQADQHIREAVAGRRWSEAQLWQETRDRLLAERYARLRDDSEGEAEGL